MVMLSQTTVAGDGPKVVRGYIWDNAGNPLEDADVTVNIRNPDNSIQSTQSTSSNSAGFYSVIFLLFSEWDDGDTIEVVATWNSNQDSNTTIARNGQPVQYVNVSFPFEIDEFGSTELGIVIAGGAVGAIAVVLLVSGRRKR